MQRQERDPPNNADEARYQMRMLVADMRAIENQLSNRNRTDFSGARIITKLYWLWNHKAKRALAKKQIEHRFLKDWLKENGDTEKILADVIIRALAGFRPTQADFENCYKASGYYRKIVDQTPLKKIP